MRLDLTCLVCSYFFLLPFLNGIILTIFRPLFPSPRSWSTASCYKIAVDCSLFSKPLLYCPPPSAQCLLLFNLKTTPSRHHRLVHVVMLLSLHCALSLFFFLFFYKSHLRQMLNKTIRKKAEIKIQFSFGIRKIKRKTPHLTYLHT